jgi:hypothetical protein
LIKGVVLLAFDVVASNDPRFATEASKNYKKFGNDGNLG